MSFILDALKKSESDRQRQTGPALFEVKVAPPRARFPVWAIAIAGLLVINMIIVGWMLLRRPSHGDETAATTAQPGASGTQQPASTPASAATTQLPPAGYAQPPAGTAGNFNAQPGYSQQGGAPPGNSPPGYPPAAYAQPGNPPAGSAPPAAGTQQPQAPANMPQQGAATFGSPPGAPNQYSTPANQPGTGNAAPRLPDRDQNEPTLAGNNPEPADSSSGGNPDDYAPANDPGSPMFKGHVKRGTMNGMTLYQDAALAPGSNLPELRLDLHVYAAKPEDRFALINMRKLHEGDALQGGVRVDSITPDGVVMSHNGSKFLLPRE
jgi:general secretion pathway protein B